jgi:purine nucleoside phosphorylase
MRFAIIGGTGCQNMVGSQEKRFEVDTPYGSAELSSQEHGEHTIYHVLRHGKNHSIPPHLINYRANIDALRQLEVSHAIGIYAVGSITSMVLPGNLGLIDQFIDFTGGSREGTFFTGGDAGVRHVPMVSPYSKRLRAIIARESARLAIPLALKGIYVCTNGPRLETPAEISMFRRWGADYVGMTAATETVLAAEADIEFAGIVYSINWAAGLDAEGFSFIEKEIAERITGNLSLLAKNSLLALGTEP